MIFCIAGETIDGSRMTLRAGVAWLRRNVIRRIGLENRRNEGPRNEESRRRDVGEARNPTMA
jgi:hypothetical protein